MTAIEWINDAILPLETTDKISLALRLMSEGRVRHLPVIKDKKFLGIISENQLLEAEDDNQQIEVLGEYLQKISIDQSDHYYNALRLLSGNKLSIIPVVDEAEIYLGTITSEDMAIAVAGSMAVENPGGIIVLHIHQKDYSLSEIAKIVESNDAKILSMGLSTLPNPSLLQITLKLNKINIEAVIQTFNRYEYDIFAYFGENEKDEEFLRERYESLMKYLKV